MLAWNVRRAAPALATSANGVTPALRQDVDHAADWHRCHRASTGVAQHFDALDIVHQQIAERRRGAVVVVAGSLTRTPSISTTVCPASAPRRLMLAGWPRPPLRTPPATAPVQNVGQQQCLLRTQIGGADPADRCAGPGGQLIGGVAVTVTSSARGTLLTTTSSMG